MNRDRFLRPCDVETEYGIDVSTLSTWRMRERQTGNSHGPRWQHLGGRRIVYRQSDVEAWIQAESRRR